MMHSQRARVVHCAAGGLILATTNVWAASVQRPMAAPGDRDITANCDVQGYGSGSQTLDVPTDIPDNDSNGVTIGPIEIPANGTSVADVIVSLSIAHTWVGDLIVAILYDQDANGSSDVASRIICRPGRQGACDDFGSGDGCSADLSSANVYTIQDFASQAMEFCNPPGSVFPTGCYRPSGLGAGALFYFQGFRAGGRWWLNVSDHRAGDTGSISGWSLYVREGPPIAVSPGSWGRVKFLYH